MARQFLIGELGSTSYTSGKLADTGLNIEALSVADDEGPISWAVGDAVPDMIRFVQGTTSGPNVYSNWINPRNIIVADGSSAETATCCEVDLVMAGTAALVTGGTASKMILELKFVHKNGLVEEFWNLSASVGMTAADPTRDEAAVQAAIKTAYDAAVKPDWLMATCSVDDSVATAPTGASTISTPATTTVTFTGSTPGSTLTSSGDAWDGDAVQFTVIVTATNDIDTQTYTPAVIVAGDNGVGTYYSAKKFEEKSRGIMYGYYNRRNLPNTPDFGAVSGSTYDFLTIVATKDGSAASGQIHGVDNLDEIFIAGKEGVATWSETANTCFVDKLNGILALTNPTLPGVSV